MTLRQFLLDLFSPAKGDSDIKAQEKQQLGFNNQLQNIFTQQFGAQSGILNFMNQKLTNQVNNPQGFTPAQMAVLNTSNTEGAARAFADAQKATQAGEAARGGSTLPSGVSAQLSAENANAAAGQEASGNNAIQLANAQQQQSNYWNALSGMSGVAQQENPTGFAGDFNSGSSNVGSLGQAYNQTQQSQLMSTLGGIAAGAASGAGMALCPAEGSPYLMADGTEKPVEALVVGDLIQGIDGEPQTIEEIQTARTPIVRVETADGFVSRSSRVHAFALPHGGFVVAMHARGKTIRTAKGISPVVSVRPDGEAVVYNVITDGSHTYRASGIWALGVGEAERVVSMETWNRVGDRLESKEPCYV